MQGDQGTRWETDDNMKLLKRWTNLDIDEGGVEEKRVMTSGLIFTLLNYTYFLSCKISNFLFLNYTVK